MPDQPEKQTITSADVGSVDAVLAPSKVTYNVTIPVVRPIAAVSGEIRVEQNGKYVIPVLPVPDLAVESVPVTIAPGKAKFHFFLRDKDGKTVNWSRVAFVGFPPGAEPVVDDSRQLKVTAA
jgi:hypothetical protein